MWCQWLEYFDKLGMAVQVYYLNASYYGDATVRQRLHVVAQPESWLWEIGPFDDPPTCDDDPPCVYSALEAPGDMDPKLDICSLDDERYTADPGDSRTPKWNPVRAGWFHREKDQKPLAVWSADRPAWTVRAYGDGATWHDNDDFSKGGPGAVLYADEREGRRMVIALSASTCARIQKVPIELAFPESDIPAPQGGEPVYKDGPKSYVKRLYELAGNAVPGGMASAMAGTAIRQIQKMRRRARLYLENPSRAPAYEAFVKWRNISHRPRVPSLRPTTPKQWTQAPRRGDPRTLRPEALSRLMHDGILQTGIRRYPKLQPPVSEVAEPLKRTRFEDHPSFLTGAPSKRETAAGTTIRSCLKTKFHDAPPISEVAALTTPISRNASAPPLPRRHRASAALSGMRGGPDETLQERCAAIARYVREITLSRA